MLFFLVSSIGYLDTIISKTLLNYVYQPLGIDLFTGNTVLFLLFWSMLIYFYYTPKYAPLLLIDSVFFPNFCYPDFDNKFQPVKIENKKGIYLLKNNVFYETDIETLKLLGLINLDVSKLEERKINFIQKNFALFIFKISNFEAYVLEGDIPIFLLRNGVKFLQITDVYTYHYFLDYSKCNDFRHFERLDPERFNSLFDLSTIPKSKKIRDFPKLDPYIEQPYLKDIFESKAVNGWLNNRYFRELHFRGNFDERLDDQTSLDFNRWKEIGFLRTCNENIHLLKEINSKLSSIQKLHPNVDEIINIIESNYLKFESLIDEDIKSLTFHFHYDKKFQKTIDSMDFRPILDQIIDDLKVNYYSSGIRGYINEILEIVNFFKEMQGRQYFSCDNRGTLIVGEAFTGKTHFLSNLVDRSLNEELSSVLSRCGVRRDEDWFNVIKDTINGSPSNQEILFNEIKDSTDKVDMGKNLFNNNGILRSKSKFLIGADALDEAVRLSDWENLMKEAEAIINKNNNIHFVYTTRPNFINAFPNVQGLPNIDVIFIHKSELDLDKIFEKYKAEREIPNIEEQQWLKKYFDNPLQIRLFFEAFEKTEINFDDIDISINSLFEQYLDSIENKIRDRDSLEVLKHVNSGFVQGIFDELGAILINEDSKFVQKVSLLEVISKAPFVISEDIFMHILMELKYHDLILIDIDEGSEVIRLQENSLLEFSIAKSAYNSICNNVPELIPDYLVYKKGALEMFGQMMIKEKESLIFKDFWQNQTQINDGLMREILLGILKGIPNHLINDNYNDWIYSKYALGPRSLHNFLMKFETPFERDKIWSGPAYFEDSSFKDEGTTRIQKQRIKLILDYPLDSNDNFDGLPLVYAWYLTTLDNNFRLKVKTELIKWGIKDNLEKFISLLNLTFQSNDPQMKEDLILILEDMSKIILPLNKEKSVIVRDWLLSNCFKEDIPIFDSVAIRSGCLNILRLCAKYCDVLNLEEKTTLPYPRSNKLLKLDLEYFTENFKSPIGHDLEWYVVGKGYDEFLFGLSQEIEALASFYKPYIEKYKLDIGNVSFAHSAIISKLKDWGWTKEGLSTAMTQSTHGGKSNLQTIVEKYIWCAVHELYGFLADKLPKIQTKTMVQDYRNKFNFFDISERLSNNVIKEIPFKDINIFKLDFLDIFPNLKEGISTNDKVLAKEWVFKEIQIDWNKLVYLNPVRKSTKNEIEDLNKSIVTYANISDLDTSGNGEIHISISACSLKKESKAILIKNDFNINYNEIRTVSDITSSVIDMPNLHPRDLFLDDRIETDYEYINLTSIETMIQLKKLNISLSHHTIDSGDTEFVVPIMEVFDSCKGISFDGNSVIDDKGRYLSFYNRWQDGYSVYQNILHVDQPILLNSLGNNQDIIWFASVFKNVNPQIVNNNRDIYSRYQRVYMLWEENGMINQKLIYENDYEN